MDGPGRTALAATLSTQAAGCRGLDSPFYGELFDRLADEAERDGPAVAVLTPHAHARFEDAYALRLLGGVHRLVLEGAAPALAAHFPSTGGDGDVAATVVALEHLLADPPPVVLDAMRRPPQTNEAGRSVALVSGLLVVAAHTGLPVRLRELGASGGLNLQPDAYWFEQGGRGWGDATSAVRFVDLWDGGVPPFDAPLSIADRRGCDRDPVDVSTDDGSLTLLSYVWPQPEARFTRARAAIAAARARPVVVDAVPIGDWVPAQVRDPVEGTTLVVMHSVVWQYLDDETRRVVTDVMTAAGEAATPSTPVAWLRLEPTPDTYVPAELRLTLWDGRGTCDERFLATSGFHGGPLHWHEDS